MRVPVAARLGSNEQDCTGAASKRELYFIADTKMFVSTRATDTDAWGAPTMLLDYPGVSEEGGARLSPDDLTMYFSSSRPGGAGSFDLWRTTRASTLDAWMDPVNEPEVNTPAVDKWLSLCAGGRYLMVRTLPGLDDEILEGTLGVAAPVVVANLNSVASETGPALSADCNTVYFSSNRNGTDDIFVSTRRADGSWALPTLFTEASTPDDDEEDAWMSPDQRLFIFARGIPTDKDVYMMVR